MALRYMYRNDAAGGHKQIDVVEMAYKQNNKSLQYASEEVQDEIRAKRQKK